MKSGRTWTWLAVELPFKRPPFLLVRVVFCQEFVSLEDERLDFQSSWIPARSEGSQPGQKPSSQASRYPFLWETQIQRAISGRISGATPVGLFHTCLPSRGARHVEAEQGVKVNLPTISLRANKRGSDRGETITPAPYMSPWSFPNHPDWFREEDAQFCCDRFTTHLKRLLSLSYGSLATCSIWTRIIHCFFPLFSVLSNPAGRGGWPPFLVLVLMEVSSC